MNRQRSSAAKIKHLSRKLGANPTTDFDGVVAVLSIARRLVKEQGIDEIAALNSAADNYASPKDKTRAFWSAHKAFSNTSGDTLDRFDEAVAAVGLVNALVKKGKQ